MRVMYAQAGELKVTSRDVFVCILAYQQATSMYFVKQGPHCLIILSLLAKQPGVRQIVVTPGFESLR
jgi:hypothetical protein